MRRDSYSSISRVKIVVFIRGFTFFWWNMQAIFKCLRDLFRYSCDFVFHHFRALSSNDERKAVVPVSVNYHFTRACNYKCGFCFHTSISSYVLPIVAAKRGLSMLKEAGMEKINFSGGEPFIHKKGRFLGELVHFCKVELKMDSVSIVSNGSLIREEWMANYGQHLDILAISCDSFVPQTNNTIGRYQNNDTEHIQKLYEIRDWCEMYEVVFKINTVVNKYNLDEDMSAHLRELKPARWKVFQCLRIEGENAGPEALRDASNFYVTSEEFDAFVGRHSIIDVLVAEDNSLMKDSYLMLDERMRFLDCRNGGKQPSESILDVGVHEALQFSGFDEKAFLDRGGVYEWNKSDLLKCTDTSDW